MELSVLAQKINTLKHYSREQQLTLSDADIDKFAAILAKADDWDLFRINPLHFAEQHSFATDSMVDLFVIAAKVGLFDFVWNEICPSCGRIEHSHENLNHIDAKHFHCALCRMDVSSALDDYIEVAFSIHPSIQSLHLDPFSGDMSHYHRYYFSNNLLPSEAKKVCMNDSMHAVEPLEAEAQKDFEIEVQAGQTWQVTSFALHRSLMIKITAGNAQSDLEVDLLKNGFSPEALSVPAGTLHLRLNNHSSRLLDVLVLNRQESKMMEILEKHPSQFRPMLTGKMLLNNHSFRELFRVQDLKPDLHLNIRSLTVLFTDLKGSTDLYDKLGDADAYHLIQSHFNILSQAVRAHRGAIVKTMGDAIMASFSSPNDASQAALLMAQGIVQFNREHNQSHLKLGLKVGLHEGTVLAVNADERLDYFGQTVNIAARVQGLASAGEIWVSDYVLKHNGVADLFAQAGYHGEKQQVSLKGVQALTTVHKMSA